jgi:putative Holliday junction resolvase
VSAPTRLLGVDPGRARIGLAISDPDRKFSFPLETYERQGRERDAEHFRALCTEHDVAVLVVGLPLRLDGHEGPEAHEARTFGRWLAGATGLPVVFFDERFTTVQAEHALWDAGLTHKKRKARRDRVAAQILLQTYIEAGCPEEELTTEAQRHREEQEEEREKENKRT